MAGRNDKQQSKIKSIRKPIGKMYQKFGVSTTLSLNRKNKKIRLKVVISNPIKIKLTIGFK